MSLATADRLAISELLARAAYAYDERNLALLESCFCEEATFSILIRGGDMIGPFTGREAIMALYAGAMEQQTDVRRHVVSNLLFESEGPEPTALSNLTLFATENAESRLLTTGIYRDVLRQEDGQWRLYRRHLDLDGPY